MPEVDFGRDLNQEQHDAVTAPRGAALVLAAAGTGKTRTLVYRVAYLVGQGVSPERILLLTFTNKAAREMLERARALVGNHISGVWGGTFHHMANRMLRRHAPALGYPSDYVILDRDDSLTLISQCVKDRKLQAREFPSRDVLMALFSASANTRTPLKTLIEQRFSDTACHETEIIAIHGLYEKKKRALAAMDFDDLLVNCAALFHDHPDILSRYQQQFEHVLVDEYQDTNVLQAEIVRYLSSKHGNVMVVGDDFQSIYSWRGADYRNIMAFPERYGDVRMYKLETNYRSVPEILEVANACIRGNPEQFHKTLRPTREAAARPRVVKIRSGDEQARWIVEEVRRQKREGYRLSDIAVLYRAHYHSMELQLELAREDIPYLITSGVRFFEQAHIKDVCSVLRILVSDTDELAFARLLCMLPGVGERTAQKLWRKLGSRFDASDEAHRAAVSKGLRKAAQEGWQKIAPVLRAYREEGLEDDGGEIVYRFTDAFYEAHVRNKYENAETRLDDIRELVLYTAKFESVESFLSDIALMTNIDAEDETLNADGDDVLRLSTIHQAKGLEWPMVIIIWATDGMFPSSRSLEEAGGEAEERRLFYVAVTRAKDELDLCIPEIRRMRDGKVMYCSPSRFVQEIPAELLEEHRVPFI